MANTQANKHMGGYKNYKTVIIPNKYTAYNAFLTVKVLKLVCDV